ncbi:MAG: GMC family oxidoreductase [Sandaracinus sp.]|nr:GMC family oxidoreductase [Sandaracinus sp.]
MGYESGRDHVGDLRLSCDVVVVGSGAAGSTVATELALSGVKVLVLEEGARVDAAEHGAMRPSESLRHVWRDGGFSVAMGVGDSPAINVTMGRVVGGSSMVTGGVCFRTPDHVLDTWVRAHGLKDYAPKAMSPYFDEVEKHLHVETVTPDRWSRSTHLFDAGLRKKGEQLASLRRNTKGCHGCGRCNFGCPEKAKMSVDLSYLPRAVEKGATVLSHAKVEKIRFRGRRAIGVEGRVLNGRQGRPGGKLVVDAKRVVIAGSAWVTPTILRRSGIKHDVLGKKLTLHPGFRMIARFDEEVEGWKGAMQSAYTDAFEERGLTLVSLFIPVSVIGATMPGIGPDHVRNARQMKHLAMFGGMIHDEGGGTVMRGPGGDPFVTYRMSKRDRHRIPDIVRTLGETFLEAGAKEVFPPVLGLERGLDPDAFRRFDFEGLPARRFECSSQHPLGSARIGSDRRASVCDPDGRVWDAEELYVVDGSVLPTSLGVNPQESIMAVATKLAWTMRERRYA